MSGIGGIGEDENVINPLSGIGDAATGDISGQGTSTVDAGSISPADQQDELKDTAIPMFLLQPSALTPEQQKEVAANLHKELNMSNWKAKLVSEMWDRFNATIKEIEKQSIIDEYNAHIRNTHVSGDRLRAEYLKMDAISQLIIQNTINMTTLDVMLNANRYIGRSGAEALVAVNYATFAGMALSSQSFENKLQEYAIHHISTLFPEGLAEAKHKAMASKWVAYIHASLAFTALSVLQITGASKEGGAAEIEEQLMGSLARDINTMRKYMSLEEINELFAGLVDDMRYATSMDGVLGMPLALINMVESSADSSSEERSDKTPV